jgi:signal transduction histidine kinase
MTALRARVDALDPIRVDVIVALVAIIELELQSSFGRGISDLDRLVTVIACVLYAGPIAVRRRAPGVALVFCAAVAAIETPLNGQLWSGAFSGTAGDVMPALVLLVLGYGAGAWLNTRRGVAATTVAIVLVFICSYLPDGGGAPTGVGETAKTFFYAAIIVAPGWLAGRFSRAQARRSAGFMELAAVAAAEQAARRTAAIASERERIGGELQDIIAHSVSVMVVQAGSARLQLRSDPDRARASILNVEHTGREALADLRRLLGMLRKDDDPRALSPQPGLKQLPALIESIQESGFACELRTEGDRIDLTPGVDLVAYRVIETALHAAAEQRLAHGAVTTRYTTGWLELEISGDGEIPGIDERLRAISDRVALYDGTLRTASARGSGFEMHARLPTRTAVPV